MNLPAESRHRKFQKPEWARERERVALELVVAGATIKEIAGALDVAEPSASRIVARALERRAKQVDVGIAAQVRALYISRIELMISKWMPLATGTVTGLPDKDAADVIFKCLDRLAKMFPIQTAPEIVINNTVVTVETMRDQVMASLEEVAARQQVIEGTLISG